MSTFRITVAVRRYYFVHRFSAGVTTGSFYVTRRYFVGRVVIAVTGMTFTAFEICGVVRAEIYRCPAFGTCGFVISGFFTRGL